MMKNFETNGNLAMDISGNSFFGGSSYVNDLVVSGLIKEYYDTKDMTASELVGYYCGKGKPKKAISSVIVTKEDAGKFLDTCGYYNRRTLTQNLKRIKSDMQNGEWDETSDMCIFDENGNMLNAGHRMLAIYQTGIPQRITIGFNYEFSSKQDSGSKRTTAQNIKMMIRIDSPKVVEISNEKIYAKEEICSAVKLILKRYGIDGGNTNNVIKYMKRNKESIEAIANMMFSEKKYKRTNNKGLFAAGFIAACIIAYQSGISINQLRKFRDVWGSAGKIVDESMDGTRYDEMLAFRDKINQFGLADSGNKNAYFRDCLFHFYAADRFMKLYGRKNNMKEIKRDMPIAFKVDYDGCELSIPWNATYKDGRKKK